MTGQIGGDSDLTDNGRRFASQLATFVNGLENPKPKIWTSWLKRTIETAKGNKNTISRICVRKSR